MLSATEVVLETWNAKPDKLVLVLAFPVFVCLGGITILRERNTNGRITVEESPWGWYNVQDHSWSYDGSALDSLCRALIGRQSVLSSLGGVYGL